MSFEPEKLQAILDEADCLYTPEQVSAALDRMAVEINQRLADRPTLCLGVMLGGLIPTGQLLPRLRIPLTLDYIHASRYRGETQGSELHWLKYPKVSLEGKTVLIIDDILDEGLTLKALVEYCQEQKAAEVLTAVLVEKELPNPSGLEKADFTGLVVPNRYVFGFGMDYQENLRSAAGIYAVKGL